MSQPIALPTSSRLTALTDLQRVFFGYLADYQGGTHQLYEYHLTRYLKWCEAMQIDGLHAERTEVAIYVRHLVDMGLRASTINTNMTPVKGFYKWAMLEGYVDRDPAVHVKLPKSDYRQKYPLEKDEVRKFRQTAKAIGGRHWALSELLTVHALRITEAVSVRIENVQATERGHRVMTLRRKGGKWRTIPIPIAVLNALEDAIGDRTSGTIIARRDGQPMTRSGGVGLVDTIVRRAKLEHAVNPHLLRASVITIHLDSGGDIREAQRLADHEDPRTTSKHYDLSKHDHNTHPVHIVSARLTV